LWFRDLNVLLFRHNPFHIFILFSPAIDVKGCGKKEGLVGLFETFF
jgi:hypothetical protein